MLAVELDSLDSLLSQVLRLDFCFFFLFHSSPFMGCDQDRGRGRCGAWIKGVAPPPQGMSLTRPLPKTTCRPAFLNTG